MDIDGFSRAEYNQHYISRMRPIFNMKALFSDMTEDYVSPAEPSAYGEVTIRIRTKRNNVDKVFFVCDNENHLMMKSESDDYFDYYSHTVQLENREISYYFEIHAGKIICYYNYGGASKSVSKELDFRLIPGYKTPDWAKGAVMYQIYVDRFCNGDPSNDVLTNEYRYIGENTVKVEDWDKHPAAIGIREFYGGDLQGVLDKMDYLQDLGVDVIYFNPLFVSPSNHKYDIQDYDYIDPHFGKIVEDKGELLTPGVENRFASKYINRVTNKANLEASNQLFIKVVEEAHRRGMKVILDGVFNHCGSFNKWMDRERIYENAEGYEKGAYVDRNSPYHNYFIFHDKYAWPYNGTYDGWWGHDTLPKLNFEGSKELFDYVMCIAKKWVSAPYNADGWRLDVAADLGHSQEYNHYFWKQFYQSVKEANPNAIVLAEHYGNPRDWLHGDEWDTIMNYDAFMEPLTWFLTGMQKHSDDYREDMYGNVESFWGAMIYNSVNMTMPSMYISMNELSNHDHSRFLTRTNQKVGRTNTIGSHAADEGVNKAVLREAVVVQMTWPGAPTIYYGDEAGVKGFTDPDNRRTYPWGKEDKELIDFHKAIIQIHKRNKEFLTGSVKWYKETPRHVLAYGRFNKEEQSLVVVNNSDVEIMQEIQVWYLGTPREGVMNQLIFTGECGYNTEMKEYPIVSGKVSLTLPPTSAVILKYKKKQTKNFLQFK
ncbi:glycoside hydrolase family 13 protein [Kineothrix sp. MB12-C1]|uniref:glycoside hydrolase family 13 protein n=1 Tax=Kineothrix sp. MB12-C1 TaxID=3070215 RepID=UPI0027D2C875|nr:glycoside hydrolase family 13 protein [Kineothrix sp. MB12-C1]WMC91211.1 glycoside hydrolase family 13 protein [Kineothrix sp. MB12-C1]